MKKISLFLAFIGMITLGSCSTNNDNNGNVVDNDTISEVYEVRNKDFVVDGNNSFSYYETLNPQILPSDVIIMFRLSGTINSSTPIWQPIPRTIYTNFGELDYDFDFSKQDFIIYARGSYDLTLTPNYLTNQTFRLVIIPGYASNKMASVDLNDYNAVVKAFHIDESKIKVIK